MIKGRHRLKNQFIILDGSSKFHEAFRQLMVTEFKHMNCYQEVNVRVLVEDYLHDNHHFDWWLSELGLVVELHGNQHYRPTAFGNISKDQAVTNFHQSQFRDYEKREAALSVGLKYIEIPYKYKRQLTKELLWRLVDEQNQ